MIGRTEITNEVEWLEFRKRGGIGASEAAAVIGQSPWISNVELWKRKTGRTDAPDISNNAMVEYGHNAEPLIRGLFALDYADKYETEYRGAFDVVKNPKYPFIFATLDGRLKEIKTGRLGVLEIKTTSILRSMSKENWWKDGKPCLPQQYYCQLLWQLIATGFSFAILHAQLKYQYGDDIRSERRTYFVERSDCIDDIEYLESEGVKFWTEYVQKDKAPALILPPL